MGILTSLLMPILKTGAVIGASAIPGIGPVAGPVVGGLLSAGQGLASGQGPLTSLTQGAIQGGMSYGMGQLGDMMQGPEGVADTSNLGQNVSLADPNMFGQAGSDPLTDWAMRDLQEQLAKRNSFMIGGGGF